MGQQSKANFSQSEPLYVLQRTGTKVGDNFSFDAIKNYIKSCPAAQDPLSRIIIEEDAIYFGHGLMEINAAFPQLPNFILVRPTKSFSEDNIESYGYNTQDARILTRNPIEAQQNHLKEEAGNFFSTLPKKQPLSVTNSIKNLHQPQDILCSLLDSNDTVAIGEIHTYKSSKKILIDNMKKLKEKGVDVVYLEHVFYDSQKDLFDAYFSSDSLELPVMLKDYLQYLDRGFNLSKSNDFSPYSFLGLVVQAKRCGIRIIPIDTIASYSTGSALYLGAPGVKDPADRCLMMNYVAAKNYMEEKRSHQKAIFFVGADHINDVNSGIPGITEITQSPTIVVEDNASDEEELTAGTHPNKPDLLIYMDTTLSEEAKQLKAEYELHVEQGKLRKEEQLRKQKAEELQAEEQERARRQQIIGAANDRLGKILNNLRERIGEIDQHHLAEAYDKSIELLEALEDAKSEYLQSLGDISVSSSVANRAFETRCTTLINRAKTVLERDLGWGDYLTNLLKSIANAIIRVASFGLSNSFFSLVRSESVVAAEETEIKLCSLACEN
ncbi:membrane-targeted effector domain-containing toxin [Legionella fallonii]|uniref:Uncharacterized protein n=1 Tax=Legionella fallonii LLAP-10 TaxID=1212491 RepID=A0A098G247_9GAMM|nr:membrane-targeted effector domain-containing toxin [Legionella fallonii]CEG56056.1 protein of unknown function [Legionella fallonii LLAP-10]